MRFSKIVLGLAAASVAFSASAALRDGTYEARVNGHNAPLTVKVTIAGGKLSAIDTSKNLESNGIGRVALPALSRKIIDRQSIGIDAMTGATISSGALVEGVQKCLEQAGATKKDLEQWNKNTEKYATAPVKTSGDVIVIGGGGSGMAAALSALESGAKKVVILEKLGYLGGSTQVSGGAFNAVDDKRQKAQGIVDSFPIFFEATMRGGHYKGDPELVHYLTYNSIHALEWLEKEGVVFRDKIGAATGSLGQRSHYGVKPAGWAYTSVFESRLKSFGDRVEILTDTQAKSLVMKNGAVAGVKALRHGKQSVTVTGPSVVIATGGFGANIPFRQKVNTGVWKEVKLDSRIGTTNVNKAAQGDGLKIAQQAGADIIGLSDIQLHPNGTPGTGLMQDIATSGRNRLFINKNGDRFVSEGAARDTLCKAIFKQPGGTYYLLMNKLRYPDENKPDRMGVTMKDMLALGRVKKAATLDDMAKILNVPADHLKAAVEEYNKAARNKGTPDKFGFVATNTDDAPMTEGPWYACRKVPTVHHTMGGIRINVNAQVLNKKGAPIKGLYAAGEVTGGIHGANRLGGNAIADVYTFGKKAGESAAKKL
ncbi:MAG: flavocytochrome c [Mesosutterella sp.]|nr:flavocytochrome c [Mesosutterella sp.]